MEATHAPWFRQLVRRFQIPSFLTLRICNCEVTKYIIPSQSETFEKCAVNVIRAIERQKKRGILFHIFKYRRSSPNSAFSSQQFALAESLLNLMIHSIFYPALTSDCSPLRCNTQCSNAKRCIRRRAKVNS